jgi:hypothetical protein
MSTGNLILDSFAVLNRRLIFGQHFRLLINRSNVSTGADTMALSDDLGK